LRIVDIKLLFGRAKAFIPGILGAGLLPVLFLTALLFLPCQAFADWSPLIDRLVADGFDDPVIRELFSRPEVRFDAGPMSSKLQELVKKPSRNPAAVPSYNPKRVYKSLLKQRTITQARSYLQENTDLLEDISSHYCVPKEIVVSILLVETRLGEQLGGKYAFNSLASMALCTDLETIRPYLPRKLINKKNEDYARTICRQKADWAYTELKALIDYTRVSGFDPLALPGSIYGAIGLCQFLPSNVFSYGVDADHDGRIDLFAKADALYSIANYLQEHGWKCAMDKPSKVRVIFDYNKSPIYVNTVLAVAEKLKNKSRTRQ
jgi:membrane-bound lytic murein transglycosylase B